MWTKQAGAQQTFILADIDNIAELYGTCNLLLIYSMKTRLGRHMIRDMWNMVGGEHSLKISSP